MCNGTLLDIDGKGFKTWIKKNHYDTVLTDPAVVSAVYLYNLEAPGKWVQYFVECSSADVAIKIKDKLKYGDLYGVYVMDKTLSDLSAAEIMKYKEEHIDM
jgi:hypothetical protein